MIKRIKYQVEGYYLNKMTGEREWKLWMGSPDKESALRTFEHGRKHIKRGDCIFNDVRVLEIEESCTIIKQLKD